MKSLQGADKRVPWSFLGFLAGVVFGLLGIYSVFFYSKNPDLAIEIASDSPVFSLREQIAGLEIMFQGKNIRETHQGLAVVTLQIANKGNVAVRTADFDPKDPFVISLSNGEIIKADISESSDPYFSTVFAQTQTQPGRLVFPPFIMEPNQSLAVRLLVLHEEAKRPILKAQGKIANVAALHIQPYRSQADETRPEIAFGGNMSVQLLRVGAYGLGLISAVLGGVGVALLVRGRIESARRKKRRFRLHNTIRVFLASKPAEVRRQLEPFAVMIQQLMSSHNYYVPFPPDFGDVLKSDDLVHNSWFSWLLQEIGRSDPTFDAHAFEPTQQFTEDFCELVDLVAREGRVARSSAMGQ